MNIIKDLPEVFEKFAEQRKNSFLAMKKLKDQGIPVVGAYCTYFPKEIAMAMGLRQWASARPLTKPFPKRKRTFPKTSVR